MSETPPIGKVLDGPKPRDAIHVAIASVRAGQKLKPGQRVGLKKMVDGDEEPIAVINIAPIGVVDPLLSGPVTPGEWFYLWLSPGSISSLRHNWTHPMFDKESLEETAKRARAEEIESAKEVVMEIVRSLGDELTYEEIMGGAASFVRDDENYLVQYGGENWQDDFPEMADRFWDAYETITGKKVPEGRKGNSFFSCSC